MRRTARHIHFGRRSSRGIVFGLAFLLMFMLIAGGAMTFLLMTGSAIFFHQKINRAAAVALEARVNPPSAASATNDPAQATRQALSAMGISGVRIASTPRITGYVGGGGLYPPVSSDLQISLRTTSPSVIGIPISLSTTTGVPVGTPVGRVLFYGDRAPYTGINCNIWCTQVQPPVVGSVPDGSWMILPDGRTGSFTLHCGASYGPSANGAVWEQPFIPVGPVDP